MPQPMLTSRLKAAIRVTDCGLVTFYTKTPEPSPGGKVVLPAAGGRV